jgi:Thiamine pyrophosphate enzyme, N-terminal TPP binding domain
MQSHSLPFIMHVDPGDSPVRRHFGGCQSSSMTAWTTIGQHLLRRLSEAGVRHAFGVPGDFNLNLMQQIADGAEIQWVGNCNKLNAAYAADGYARLNGCPFPRTTRSTRGCCR